MKKLVNDPRQVVREMLEGVADLSPGIALLAGENVAVRAGGVARGVAVISGGGAGHEPAHAGYVGVGMLHAAVVGDVFTSPSVDVVLAGIRAVAGPAGVVLVVKNYTGDRLNFGLAAEMARGVGIPAEVVVVADDVALRDTVEPARRRGIAGTVLVHKVAGALAEAGGSLAEVAEGARRAAAAVGTMGVGLGACTVPAAGVPGFVLGEEEIELGLGIHGEQGVARGRLRPADELVETILEAVLGDRGIGAGSRVVLVVNGLGGTPPMELAVVARGAMAGLRRRGLVVERAWCGTLLSALEMPGCSVSVMAVDDGVLELLDAPTGAPAWPGAGVVPAVRVVMAGPEALDETEQNHSADGLGRAVLDAAVQAGLALEAAEGRLTALDSAAGDGDLGLSMVRGAMAVRALPGAAEDAGATLTMIAGVLRRAIAGSSGPFYAVGLLRAARCLATAPHVDAAAWGEAFMQGVEGVAALGGAGAGDRTMLDALLPGAEAFRAGVATGVGAGAAWEAAAEAAEAGARATAGMQARLGRASYLGERAMGVEDGGAVAVAVWMRALVGVVG